jgi:excisionase family DNA binding protein
MRKIMRLDPRAEPVAQVAKSFKVSLATFYRGIAAHKVSAIRFGSAWRIPAAEISRLEREGLGSLSGGRRRASKASSK